MPACTPANHPPAEPAISASTSSQLRRMSPLGKWPRVLTAAGDNTVWAAGAATGTETAGTGAGRGEFGTTIALGVLTWNWYAVEEAAVGGAVDSWEGRGAGTGAPACSGAGPTTGSASIARSHSGSGVSSTGASAASANTGSPSASSAADGSISVSGLGGAGASGTTGCCSQTIE